MDYRRRYVPGGCYFFTVVTFERRPFLTSDLARACLRAAWTEVRRHHPFQVLALCLLPDHLHCLWQLPEKDVDFSTRWKHIKGNFSRRYRAGGGNEGERSASRLRTREAAFWQRRFWEHLIRDESDYANHVNYIHYNPVKHGYAQWPGEWPWSSFHRFLAEEWYDREWGWTPPKMPPDFKTPPEP